MIDIASILTLLATPTILEFIASYAASKGLDNIVDRIGSKLSRTSPEIQFVDALGMALRDTCEHFAMEYDATIAEEMFLRALNEANIDIDTQKLKEILVTVIGRESMQYAGDEDIFNYWVYSFDKALSEPERQEASKLLQSQALRRIEAAHESRDKKPRYWIKYKEKVEALINTQVPYDTFTLSDIYVQLFGYYRIYGDANNLVERYVIFKTDEWLYQWITNKNEQNILLISGKPASGKTTLLKKLAATLIRQQYRAIFIPLRRFNFANDFHQSVCNFCRKEIGYDIFNESFDWENIVLLFDGLDEIALRGTKSLSRASEFIELLVKEYSESDIKIIVSGRDLSISAISNLFIHRGREYVLHLFPLYFDLEFIDTYWPGVSGDEIEDLRSVWWQNYGDIRQVDYSEKQDEIMNSVSCLNEVFDEITGEPFLLYLLASCYDAKVLDFDNIVSVNDLYKYFMKRVYRNEWKDKSNTQVIISENDFLDFMKEVSLCSWFSGKQIIPMAVLKKRLDTDRFQPIIKRLADGAELSEGITSLLLLFYIDKSAKDESEQSFEFTHKSFSDYFIGLKVSEFIIDMFAEKDVGPQEYSKLFDILGRDYLNLYIDDFMCQELSRVFKNTPEKITSSCKHIVSLFPRLIVHGERYACMMDLGQDTLPHDASIILEKNLFRIMGALAKIQGENITISFQKKGSFVDWINSYITWYGADIDNPNDYATNVIKLVSRVNFSQLFAGGIQFPDYQILHCNFNSVTLSSANLWFASIAGSTFSDTTFRDAIFTDANIQKSQFSVSPFTGANFSHTVLDQSEFETCNFSKAMFIETRIKKVVFKDCVFKHCNFIKVQMEQVTFDHCTFDGLSYQSTLKATVFIENHGELKLLETNLIDCMRENEQIIIDGANINLSSVKNLSEL